MSMPARSTDNRGQGSKSTARPVRDFVLENPSSAGVFEQFGIDYCCGGAQTLAEACKAAGCPVEEVTAALEKPGPASPQDDWRSVSLTELAQHIVDVHHAFTQSEINRVTGLLAKVVAAHGLNHPELSQLQMTFAGLAEELREHMRKEENMLFPYIAQLEEAARMKRQPPAAMFGTVQNPVAVMVMEHEASGQALERMRELTKNFMVPADGCTSYHALYQALPVFAVDLHQHIHLENNILFPRASELENDLSETPR